MKIKSLIFCVALTTLLSTARAIDISIFSVTDDGVNTTYAFEVEFEAGLPPNTANTIDNGDNVLFSGITGDFTLTTALPGSTNWTSNIVFGGAGALFTFNGTESLNGGLSNFGSTELGADSFLLGIQFDNSTFEAQSINWAIGTQGDVIGTGTLAIPEPSTVALLASIGVFALAIYRRRK